MPRWMLLLVGSVLGIMSFAMMASTWGWLMGWAPYPGDQIMTGRVLLGAVLGCVSGFMLTGAHL